MRNIRNSSIAHHSVRNALSACTSRDVRPQRGGVPTTRSGK
ncbi:hypothetical protein SHJG_5524 [Streptomyces hygroscopicus subsp. jinggangensis 5008]|nr:hypothetical protein SHJG_5524 [Streptomyces hygroscopicus subsp. jinggangensis 5008]AGF64950.1 hypothetical protein SHJGH_5287 [Streptomyces hygroscopicus subsp. jinggangensis TL01]